jgi:hypothetical protein
VIAWSCGGGTQSVAIGVLIGEGVLPVPDLAGIVDTAREVKTTWAYLRDQLNPYLRRTRGFEVEVIPHSLAGRDLYSANGDVLLPAFTSEGRLPTFCSGAWKTDTFERWLRHKGVGTCTFWLGFSLDERHRATGKAHRPWCQPAYPLIDRRLTRGDCVRLIEAAGLPVPSKSRCWMCSHQNAEEWAEVKADPEEWAAAVALDAAVREADERGALFLHASRVPLPLADLTVDDGLGPLFRQCQDAGCWT